MEVNTEHPPASDYGSGVGGWSGDAERGVRLGDGTSSSESMISMQ